MSLQLKNRIRNVALALSELNQHAVFVGGACIPLYLESAFQPLVRPTLDIDVVIEVIPNLRQHEMDQRLRELGFEHDLSQGAPICRWKVGGLIVDVLGMDETRLGFSNRWYAEGLKRSWNCEIEGVHIRLLSLVDLLATKLEAYRSRGHGDMFSSHDLEDLVALFDAGEERHFQNIDVTSPAVEFVNRQLKLLLADRDFETVVKGATYDRANADERAQRVLERMRTMTNIEGAN